MVGYGTVDTAKNKDYLLIWFQDTMQTLMYSSQILWLQALIVTSDHAAVLFLFCLPGVDSVALLSKSPDLNRPPCPEGMTLHGCMVMYLSLPSYISTSIQA